MEVISSAFLLLINFVVKIKKHGTKIVEINVYDMVQPPNLKEA